LFFFFVFSSRVVRADSTISSSSITMSLLTPRSKVVSVSSNSFFSSGSFLPSSAKSYLENKN
jgi:hypothetical protein